MHYRDHETIRNQLLNWTYRIIEEANLRDIVLRVIGGAGIWIHCPDYRYLLKDYNRSLPDLDFAGYLKDVVKIQQLFFDMGFEENKNVMRLFGNQRRIFNLSDEDIHIDLVLDKLHFCHDIDLRGRLEIDYPTIPLADLLLSKLQIVQINEKDILDCIVLLLEHPVDYSDVETINIDYIAKLCSNDWGLWKTTNENLDKIQKLSYNYLVEQKLQEELEQKLEKLKDSIKKKKSLLVGK